jgi:hypothetical protein
MEMESDSAIPFLEVLVLRKGMTLAKIASSDLASVTHEKRFNLECSYRAPTILPRSTRSEILSLSYDLQLNGFLQVFTDLFSNGNGSSHLDEEESSWVLCTFHMWRVFRKNSMV